MTQKRSSLLAVGLVGAAFLAACDKPPQQSSVKEILVRSSTAYADPADQKQFRDALASASIPHDVFTGPDGKEYIGWAGDQDAAVQKITVQLFGDPLPTGRHIHFSGEYGEQFKSWLTTNGIPPVVNADSSRASN